MNPNLLVPLIAVVSLALGLSLGHRWMHPRCAARLLTVALGLVIVVIAPTVIGVAVLYLAHAPVIGSGITWCAHRVGLHGSVHPILGIAAFSVAVCGLWRVVGVVRERRRWTVNEGGGIHVIESAQRFAATLPGRAGRIVISSALLETLDGEERWIVEEHERSHSRHRHDRLLFVADIATALVPPARVLRDRVRFSIERWADEDTARACGDPRMVARTLGRVALQHGSAPVAGFSGLGVAARMSALIEPPRRRWRLGIDAVATGTTIGLGLASSLTHVINAVPVLAALCPHVV